MTWWQIILIILALGCWATAIFFVWFTKGTDEDDDDDYARPGR